jgi:hypothetical protein
MVTLSSAARFCWERGRLVRTERASARGFAASEEVEVEIASGRRDPFNIVLKIPVIAWRSATCANSTRNGCAVARALMSR